MQTDANYELDFYKWATAQGDLLRAGKLDTADILNIAEEIESMGKSEKRELLSRLIILLSHLLTWDHQPSKRSKSWMFTIEEQRLQIENYLEDNPSLKQQLPEITDKAYRLARIRAAGETGLEKSAFQEQSPYSFDVAMSKEIVLF